MSKIFGELEGAQIHNLAADPTGVDLVEGKVWFRTDLDVYRGVANGIVVEFADLSTAQTFSNKSLTNPAILGYTEYDQIATPANPASNILRVYQKADGKLYTLDENGNELPLGSGSGSGGINYMPEDSRDIESTVGQWLTDDGAGSASGLLTLSTTSVVGEVLRSGSSLKLAKSGADADGHFIKCATLDIDPADYEVSNALYYSQQLKPLTGYVANDLILEFYDVTNAEVLYSRGVKDIALQQGLITAVTWLNSDTVTVEVRLRVQNTNTNSFEVSLDAFSFGPDKIIDSPVVTYMGQYTPTVTPATGTISGYTVNADYWRIGDTVKVIGQLVFDGAPGTWTAPKFSQPPGLTVDSTKLPAVHYGSSEFNNAGTGWSTGTSQLSGTDIAVTVDNTASTYTTANNISQIVPFTWVSGDSINFEIEYPVEEWANSSAVLSTTEMLNTTAKVAAVHTNGQSIPQNVLTILTNWGEQVDTAGNFNATTGVFTAPKTQKYNLSFRAMMDWTSVQGSLFIPVIRVNGTEVARSVFYSPYVTVFTNSQEMNEIVELQKGDTVDFGIFQSGTGATVTTDSRDTTISINELPDLSVYSVYGQTEFLQAQSGSDTTITPISTWVDVSGMALPLKPGEYDGDYSVNIFVNNTTGSGQNFDILSRVVDGSGVELPGSVAKWHMDTATFPNLGDVAHQLNGTFNAVLSEEETYKVQVYTTNVSIGAKTDANSGGFNISNISARKIK